MITASIITIGDELLIGQVIDTNSAWIAQQLNKAGIPVSRRVAIGDVENEIIKALNEEGSNADIILITGGLGPTSDDITKPILCNYFNGQMIIDQDALENVKYLYREVFKKDASPENLKQAEVPDVCTVIPNKRGTAPGMWFEKDGKIFISMPGVPYEMQGMINNFVVEKIVNKFKLPFIVHRTLLTSGVGESVIAQMLTEFETQLPKKVKLAYLPSYGMVRLRLSSSGIEQFQVESEVEHHFHKLKALVNQFLVTDQEESMSQVVGKILSHQNKTICTAESCTGGYLAHLLTAVAGSSKYYKGTIVSYDNDVKSNLLNVHAETLKSNGAVSEQTVKEMLTGALLALKTDYGIAVSGIMGPEGGSVEKPVGTVWLAVGSLDEMVTKKMHFRFDRNKNIELTSQNALDMFRKFILNSNEI